MYIKRYPSVNCQFFFLLSSTFKLPSNWPKIQRKITPITILPFPHQILLSYPAIQPHTSPSTELTFAYYPKKLIFGVHNELARHNERSSRKVVADGALFSSPAHYIPISRPTLRRIRGLGLLFSAGAVRIWILHGVMRRLEHARPQETNE